MQIFLQKGLTSTQKLDYQTRFYRGSYGIPCSLSVFPPGGLGQQDFRARSARKRR